MSLHRLELHSPRSVLRDSRSVLLKTFRTTRDDNSAAPTFYLGFVLGIAVSLIALALLSS